MHTYHLTREIMHKCQFKVHGIYVFYWSPTARGHLSKMCSFPIPLYGISTFDIMRLASLKLLISCALNSGSPVVSVHYRLLQL